MQAIYDRDGKVVGWLEREIVYSALGSPRGFLSGGVLFSFEPAYRGWLDQGYFIDEDGAAVAWLPGAYSGPSTSTTMVAPICPYLQFAMLPPLAPAAPPRPLARRAWSALTWNDYLGPDSTRTPVSKGNPPTLEEVLRLRDEPIDVGPRLTLRAS